MNNVLRALMADNEEERNRHLDRETLLYAVQRRITCERTGQALDVDSAVMVTGIKDGRRTAAVLTGEAWDEVAEHVLAKLAEIGATVKVIDGRQLT
ncbi:hypothetical protein [Verrucosispora sp. WMMD1129]|uniref:hypothetical protein n=1 Tax=Verrucosispora sp. WMMD1129 TaxID=3016093 RepID=UPI00249AC044|nr:hypothetical protein [Verrucosispora sp. WMMD1129]WFE47620.1 hypothetical protein O7624_26505 [Verrucosispora sp. WMMD1129]